MSVVISSSLVLTDVASGGGVINANNPLIGYQNLVDDSNLSTTTEDADNPASNLTNSSTNLQWVGASGSPSADEYITLALDTNEEVDYIGIARHNFYTAQIPVSIEILDSDASPDTWTEVISEVIPPSDGPLIFRFTPQGITSIRIRLQPGSAQPQAAVVYAGKLLILQRRIFVGHRPITLNSDLSVVSHRSINGHFLGRIVLSEKTGVSISMQNLTEAWIRSNWNTFRLAAQDSPFFFAWRPSDYPYETGYCWCVNDPKPENQSANGLMSVDIELEGVV